jgi:hypothetical protein
MRIDPPTGQQLEGSGDGQDASSELAAGRDGWREVAATLEAERNVKAQRIGHARLEVPLFRHRLGRPVT